MDRRIELLAIIFRLAGSEEYSMRSLPAYAAAVDTFFAPHKGHPVVATAKRLRAERGISHDAVMSLAIHATDFPDMRERTPIESSQLERWRPEDARAFLAEASDFATASNARRFFEAQKPTYEVAVRRTRYITDGEVDQRWFATFFGTSSPSRFILAVAPGNGTWAYGPRYHGADGTRELYAVMSIYQGDEDGLPAVGVNTTSTVIHEFSHSYVNPAVEKHLGLMSNAADSVRMHIGEQMGVLGYRESRTIVSEAIVRAAVARYKFAHLGAAAARRELERQKGLGFYWIDELYDLLGRYEANRERYGTFESFVPEIAAYFRELPRRMGSFVAAYEARRPRVVSMTPANGSVVDPSTAKIVFTFDRPMGAAYRLMNGPRGVETFPEPAPGGYQTGFNADRTVLSINVKLKPNFTYEFSLNSPENLGMTSAEGIALKPYYVKFTTGPAKVDSVAFVPL